MKKLILALTAASALAAAAVPAAAQPYGGYDRYGHQDRYGDSRGERLMWRIDRAERRGQINSGLAVYLRRQVQATERLAWRYSRDGVFTRWERAEVDRRYDQLASRLEREYGYGYGYRR